MLPRRLRLALLGCLLVGLAAAAAVPSLAAAGTPDYDPATPWVGMTVTASHSEITAGETYDLRRATELSGDEVQSSQFVAELRADADGELRIDTSDLEPGHNYFITGPGLASRGSVTASATFELRGQDLDAGFDDDDAENESDDTDSATVDDDSTDNDTEPARYYGTVTVDGEPAPAGTTIEAEVDGEVRGSITVETAGSYGGPNASDEQLTLAGAPASENSTITFYVTPPDGDRLAAGQTDTWEPATRSELALTVEHTDDTDPGESTINATDTTTDDSETAVTDTAPGFGVVVAIVALLGVAVLRRRHTD